MVSSVTKQRPETGKISEKGRGNHEKRFEAIWKTKAQKRRNPHAYLSTQITPL